MFKSSQYVCVNSTSKSKGKPKFGQPGFKQPKKSPNIGKKHCNDDGDDEDEGAVFPLEAILGSNKSNTEDDYTETEYYLHSDVSSESVMGLLKFIKRAEKRWSDFLSDYKDILDITTAKPKPLKIFINSNGGELFAAIPIIDAIHNCTIPIHTYIEGIAASAASLISMSGHKRFITKNSFMLIHELRTGVNGTFSNIMDEHENCIKLMRVIKDQYINRSVKALDTDDKTLIDEHVKKLNQLLDTILKRDIMLSSADCAEYKLVDHIL